MPSALLTPTNAAAAAEAAAAAVEADVDAAETDEPPKKKKRASSSKPRAAARPYKRLDGEVLTGRLTDLNKKLSVMRSKLVLLEDRLDGHANEATLRASEGV